MDLNRLSRLLPAQLSFAQVPSLISKWNTRDITLVLGTTLALVLVIRYVFFKSKSPSDDKHDLSTATDPKPSSLPQQNLVRGKIELDVATLEGVQASAIILIDKDQAEVTVEQATVFTGSQRPLSSLEKYRGCLSLLTAGLDKLKCEVSPDKKELKLKIVPVTYEEFVYCIGIGLRPEQNDESIEALIEQFDNDNSSAGECAKVLRPLFDAKTPLVLKKAPEFLEQSSLEDFYKKFETNTSLVTALLDPILQKPLRVFFCEYGDKKARVQVEVSGANGKFCLILAKVYLENPELELALDTSLTAHEKFMLYADACKVLVQCAKRFPLPKQGNESVKYADQDFLFDASVQASCPEVMQIFWRLGLVPKELHGMVESYFEAINPTRHNNAKTLRSVSQREQPAPTEFIIKLHLTAKTRLKPMEQTQYEVIQKKLLLKQTPSPEELKLMAKFGLICCSILVESTPFKIKETKMDEINIDMSKMLGDLKFPQALNFLPLATLALAMPQGANLPKVVMEELEMWATSYERYVTPQLQASQTPPKKKKKRGEGSGPSTPVTNTQESPSPLNGRVTKEVSSNIPANMAALYAPVTVAPPTDRTPSPPPVRPALSLPSSSPVRNSTPAKPKASPKKIAVPRGVVSSDYKDPSWIVSYGNFRAWVKLNYDGTQLILEGVYRLYSGETPTIASTVIANDSVIEPRDRFMIYVSALFMLYKYSYKFPINHEHVFLNAKPVVKVNTLEEAELYALQWFIPKEKKEEILKIHHQYQQQTNDEIEKLSQQYPEAALQILQQGLNGPISQRNPIIAKSELITRAKVSEERVLIRECLSQLSYPRNAVYEEGGHFWSRLSHLETLPAEAVAQKIPISLSYQQCIEDSLPSEVIPMPHQITRQLLGVHEGRKTLVEVQIDGKQLRLKKFEILGENDQWQPIIHDHDLTEEEKFELYLGLVGDLYTEKWEELVLNGMPLFEASCPEEAELFYFLGFASKTLQKHLSERPFVNEPVYVRDLVEYEQYPVALAPAIIPHFKEWLNFRNRDHENKAFGDKLSLQFKNRSSYRAKLNKAPTVASEETKDGQYHLTISTFDSAARPATVQIILSKDRNSVVIEKIEGIRDFQKNLSPMFTQMHLVCSTLYIAMKKSHEWGFKGAIKVRYLDFNQSSLFNSLFFHNKKMSQKMVNKFSNFNNSSLEESLKKFEEELTSAKNMLLEPNDFKSHEKGGFSKEDIDWLKTVFPSLTKMASKDNFSQFAHLVYQVWTYTIKKGHFVRVENAKN
ncbi:MAG: hypothetical protein JSR58_03500 [Verrucomicrobia bacterium]|nr:hypothetical protein [Verrucomicrobiota bacterium]